MDQVVQGIERAASLSPLLVLLAAATAYGIVLFARLQGARALVILWTMACLSMLILPGGQLTVDRAKRLEGVPARAECIGRAFVARTPWNKANLVKVPACRYHGPGLARAENPRLGRALLKSNSARLRARYGR